MKHTSLYRLMESLNKSRNRSTWVGVTTFGDRFTKRLCDRNINSYIMCTKLLIGNYTVHDIQVYKFKLHGKWWCFFRTVECLTFTIRSSHFHLPVFRHHYTWNRGLQVQITMQTFCQWKKFLILDAFNGHLSEHPYHVTAVTCDCGVMWLLWLLCHVMSCDCGVMWLLWPVTAVSCDCGVMWLRCHVTAVLCDCGVMWLRCHVTAVSCDCGQSGSTPIVRPVTFLTLFRWRRMVESMC